MNKKLIASFLCVAMLLSVGTSLVRTPNGFVLVDAVASATTTETSTPTTSTSTSTSSPKTSPVVWDTAVEIKRLIAINSAGGDVKLLQELLNKAGYSLKVDGIVGPKTLAAIEGFQVANGLRVDGIVGPKTVAKLAPLMEDLAEVVETVPEESQVEEVVDAVSGASIVDNNEEFLFSISEKGNWITAVLKDLTFDEELVLNGDGFENRGNPDRKIGLYATGENDEITGFTLTAPKLTINSSLARMLRGTFVGDLYVAKKDFLLEDMVVEGDLYFLNNEAKETFVNKNSTISGETILIDVDATSTASIVSDKDAFEKSIVSQEDGGNWITTLLVDMTFDKELVLDGQGYENRGTPDRKIGLYSQGTNAEGERVITHNFTLSVPKLTIKSSPARMLRGTFVGDLYVEADNFRLEEVNLIGNLYFLTESAQETFVNEGSTISGLEELLSE